MNPQPESFLRNSYRIQKKLLLLVGWYPKRTKSNQIIYYFSTSVSLFLTLIQFILMTTQIIIDINDVSKLSQVLQYYVTHLTFICKLLNFGLNKTKLLEIENSLSGEIFNSFTGAQKRILEERFESVQKVGKIFWGTIVAAMFFYILMPYLDGEKSLPFRMWMPFNSSDYFYPTVIFQLIGVCNTALINSTIDILTWILISLGSAQFDILKDNLKNINYREVSADEKLKNCVEHHKETVRFIAELEKIFAKGIFSQFIASILVICFTGFLSLIIPVGTMQFWFQICYFSCMMWQIAMYCYYGHDVITTSDKISESFYMSNWYESNVTIRKNIIIFLERVKKPVSLTAGRFVTLSLTTFTSILRSSYSYFAVLRHVYTEK